MTRKSVLGGSCSYPDTARCVLTRSDCDDPSNYISPRELARGPVNAHGGSCRWQSTVTSHILGRCVDEAGSPTECAPNIDACPSWDGSHNHEGWSPSNPNADAQKGWLGPAYECTVDTTLFGRCDYGMCAWSHEHCVEDNTWEPFSEGCTCDQVMVGACSRVLENGEKEIYCGVSKDACDEEQSWITPNEVMGVAGFDCYLCRELRTPSTLDEDSEEAVEAAIANDPRTSPRRSPQSLPTIVIVSVGSLVAIAITGLVGWKVHRTRRDFKIQEALRAEKEAAPPAATIEISGNGGELNADEWNESTDDNASVLSDDTE